MTFTYPEITTIDTFYTNDAGMLITPEKLEFGKGYSWSGLSAQTYWFAGYHRHDVEQSDFELEERQAYSCIHRRVPCCL